MLVHTVLHGLRWNKEPPVRWIPDSVMILRDSASCIDWEWVVDFAARRKVSYRLHLGLSYLSANWTTCIPQKILEKLARAKLTWTERLENRSCLRPIDYESTFGPVWAALAEFPGARSSESALGALGALLHYLRHHLNLNGRSDLPGWLGLRVLRRLRRATKRIIVNADTT
jgi:hypothetical protein